MFIGETFQLIDIIMSLISLITYIETIMFCFLIIVCLIMQFGYVLICIDFKTIQLNIEYSQVKETVSHVVDK